VSRSGLPSTKEGWRYWRKPSKAPLGWLRDWNILSYEDRQREL